MSDLLITHVDVLTDEGVLKNHAIEINNGYITAILNDIEAEKAKDSAKEVLDGKGQLATPRGLAGVSPTADQALVENADLFRTWNGFDNDRIKVLLGPHAPYTCPDDYMEKVIALSHELNCGIHMHLSETKGEVETVMKATGKTPIAHMHDLGLFWNTTLAAHCVHVTDEDMAIMSENNVAVAHNPQSNLKLASGIAPVPEMIAKGITVGLGTDGSASNNNADMLEEVRLAATLHKARLYDPKAIPAQAAWNMGTVEGAKALGYTDLGVLDKGYRADIVLYDVSGMHWMPRYNDLAALVYSANSSDVNTTIVGGKVLMKDKELLTIDAWVQEYKTRLPHCKCADLQLDQW
ncbi:MAG: amidohydrolase [Veillonella sp.]|nr:amidohydrolase [Veillonella sp.]